MVVLIAILLLQSQIYREGDWVTYSEFRKVSAVSYDLRYVYFGSSDGIAKYDKRFEKWEYPISVSDGLTRDEILVCGYDRYLDCLWIVTPHDVQKYNPSMRSSELFQNVTHSVHAIHSIGVGEEAVWFATDQEALKYSRQDGEWTWETGAPSNTEWWGKNSLTLLDSSRHSFLAPYYFLDSNFVKYEITAVAEDDRYLWLGTDGYGGWRYDPLTFQGKHLPFGLAKKPADCIAKDGDSLWIAGIGNESNGITLWDRKNENFKYFETPYISGLKSDNVFDIEVTEEFVGFGTNEGLSIYDKRNRRWQTYTIFQGLRSNNVISLEYDSPYLLCGTDFGLCVLDTKTWNIEFAPQLSSLRISDIVECGDTILFATEKGVFFIDKADTSWKQLSSPDNSLEFGTTRIATDSAGFWFGTDDGIVYYERKNDRWNRWTLADHYHLGEVVALAADDCNVWVSTRWGISRFSTLTKKWRTYTIEDGLPAPVALSILLEGDYAWFASSQGLTRFYWKNPFLLD